jgi:hypothetical protein
VIKNIERGIDPKRNREQDRDGDNQRERECEVRRTTRTNKREGFVADLEQYREKLFCMFARCITPPYVPSPYLFS